MDKFIKYGLPVNRKKVDWESEEMKEGGRQLLEILEKEFSVNMLFSYSIEVSRLNLRETELTRLKTWLKNDCNLDMAADALGVPDDFMKSFFWRGSGLLAKLYRILDLTPVVEDGKFISRFSFVDYEVAKINEGYMVISKINVDKWHSSNPSRYEMHFMQKYFFYDHKYEIIDSQSELGQDLYNAINILERLEELI